MKQILQKPPVRRQGEPLFPSVVWEKACTTMLESFRAVRKFSLIMPDADVSRQGAKAQSLEDLFPLSFASLRLGESYSEFDCD
jgi:hypothetical protein